MYGSSCVLRESFELGLHACNMGWEGVLLNGVSLGISMLGKVETLELVWKGEWPRSLILGMMWAWGFIGFVRVES